MDKMNNQALDMKYDNAVDQKMEQKNKEFEERERRYRGLLNTVFGTPDGKKLLEAWEQSYFYSPSYSATLGKEYIFIREGENKFIRKILIDLNIHKDTIEGA